VQAAPAALAKTTTAAALAKGATGSTSILTLTKGGLQLMTWTKATTTLVALVAMGAVILNHNLRRATRNTAMAGVGSSNPVPAPAVIAGPALHEAAPALPTGTPDPSSARGQALRLPREAIEEYLAQHHRDAPSLLAAYHASGDHTGGLPDSSKDLSYLREAATSFPSDPRVQLAVLAHDAFPDARRQWLDAFKAAAPSNSLADYLYAQDCLKNRQADAAVKALQEAGAKPQFADCSMEAYLSERELYRASGKNSVDASLAGMSALSEDMGLQLSALTSLSRSAANLGEQYINTGDPASAQSIAQVLLGLAEHLSMSESGTWLVGPLASQTVEAIALSNLDPNTGYAFLDGRTPAQIQQERDQERGSLGELRQQFRSVFPNLTETEQESYFERQRIYGEIAAMRSLLQQRPPGAPAR
jgi:DNA-binding phage protein